MVKGGPQTKYDEMCPINCQNLRYGENGSKLNENVYGDPKTVHRKRSLTKRVPLTARTSVTVKMDQN